MTVETGNLTGDAVGTGSAPGLVSGSGYGSRAGDRRAAGWRRFSRYTTARIISVIVVLGGWQLACLRINHLLLASPWQILAEYRSMIASGELFSLLGSSLGSFAIGTLLALIAGILIGLALGRYRMADAIFSQYVHALYATPNVALVPIILLWFGLGEPSQIVVIFLSAIFPVIYNTEAGVQSISRHYVEVARAYGAGEYQVLREITLPSSLPFIMTGVRLALARGLVGMIVAEIFTAISGLGAALLVASNTLQTARLFVIVTSLSIIGVILLQLGSWLERLLAPWKQTERAF